MKFEIRSAWCCVLMTACVLTPAAQAVVYQWTGEAGDGRWTSAGNWDLGVVPPVSSASYVHFNDEGTNTVTSLSGQNFEVGILRFKHPRGTRHTIDLAEGTLVVRSEGSIGVLDVGVAETGVSYDCGDVVISNGTLQIGRLFGTSQLPAAIRLGSTGSTSGTTGRGRLTVHGRLVTSNLTAVSIGYVGTGSLRDSTDSWLDLRDTTISSPLGENRWIMSGSLSIGHQNAGHGELRLPPSLEAMDIGGSFVVGNSGRSRGCIDFGTNSQFRALTVKGDFYLGTGGSNELRHWPREVAVTIGSPEAPTSLLLGYGGSDWGMDVELVVTNAPFTAHLNLLQIGGGITSGTLKPYTPVALLDLEKATAVQIGPHPNQIDCETMTVGYGRYTGSGILRLPATVTSLEAGTLLIGGTRSNSELAFAPGSQLTNLTVRDAFLMGSGWDTDYPNAGGSGSIVGLPENVAFRIGSPETPALLSMGDTYQYGGNGLSILAPTNGSFSAHLFTLRLGLSRRDGYAGIRATLDLRATRLDAFVVEDIAMIGCWTNTASGYRENDGGQGRLYLPAGEAVFKGPLHVGDTRNDSYGLLDLTGTRAQCGAPVEIGKTGEVIVRMRGEPAGLDLATAAPTPLTVESGGRVAIFCEAPPAPQTQAYWGFRLAGDHRETLQTLAGSGALTWDATALPEDLQKRFGIHYDEWADETIVGLLARRGTMVILR